MIHDTKSQERRFLIRRSACGNREHLTKANASHRFPGTSLLAEKSACGSQKEFNKPNTYHQIQKAPVATKKNLPSSIHTTPSKERHFVCQKKVPAAAGKTSPNLIHVTKSQEHYLSPRKKSARGSQDFTQPTTCNEILAPVASRKIPPSPIPLAKPQQHKNASGSRKYHQA